ncbi:MAG TPA: hypothetical protein VE777_07010 [Gaiellales bacterium]|nr:hypothetical protein [Gaiellales bacterium]
MPLASALLGPAILIIIGVVYGAAVGWVLVDALRFEWDHGGWSIAGFLVLCWLVWFVGFPLYVVKRRARPRRRLQT